LAEFKAAAASDNVDPTTANIQLPALAITIEHQQAANGKAEQISINIQAVPSFEAFGHFLEQANPFAFWIQATQLAWAPWLEATRAMTLPWVGRARLSNTRPDPMPKLTLTMS
jgi:hypothetical protein